MSDLKNLEHLLSLDREVRETPEVVASIRSIISRDVEARHAYVRWAHFESSLGWHLTGDANAHQSIVRQLKSERIQNRRILVWGTTAALAVVLLLTGLITTAAIHHFNPYQHAIPLVAWYTQVPDADSQLPGVQAGKLLRAGHRIQTREGKVVLRMAQGTVVAWSGLVDLELRSAQEVVIHGGNVCFHVPPQAIGFRAVTPAGVITDFGTQFGVSVGFDGSAEVHVMQGKVELVSKTEKRCPIITGESRGLTGTGEIGELQPVNESLFASTLPLLNGIPKFRGNLRFWTIPPLSVNQGAALTGNAVGVFIERQRFALPDPLTVYSPAPGEYSTATPPTLTTLPAGTFVRSYFIHADSSTQTSNEVELTFDNKILGVILSAAQLSETDPLLGLREVRYPSEFHSDLQPKFRAFMISPGTTTNVGDMYTIHPDGKTIQITMGLLESYGIQDIDQFRILVADDP